LDGHKGGQSPPFVFFRTRSTAFGGAHLFTAATDSYNASETLVNSASGETLMRYTMKLAAVAAGKLAAAAASATLVAAALAPPAMAGCQRFGFTVNDYGKDGPTKDAKELLDKQITKKLAERGITKFTTGTKTVKCELFLNFIVFDEHTCTAEATACWDGAPLPKGETTAAVQSNAAKPTDAKSSDAKPSDAKPAKTATMKTTASKPADAAVKAAEPATPAADTSKAAEPAKAADAPAAATDAPKPAAQ
jgi:hypothetical protein